MAASYGFFNAVYDAENDVYDRAYSSDEFDEYFWQCVGSGVSIINNSDSCKVTMLTDKAAVNPGFLFINGHWLAIRDEPYEIEVSGDSPLAILAHLDTVNRMIEIITHSVEESYLDSLCLAVVTPSAGLAEDTRYDTSVCGVIDTSSNNWSKIKYIQDYIENELDKKLSQVEQDIKDNENHVNEQIAKIQAKVDTLKPPAIGTIKFSASQDVGPDWLPCDGSFINERDYPELVEALGKLIPSGDKFKLISNGEINPQISNGVLYNGRLWVFSYTSKKLFGIDVNGKNAIKQIQLTSTSTYFNSLITPTPQTPIALSIVPHINKSGARLFLAQIIDDQTIGNPYAAELETENWKSTFVIFQGEFSESSSSMNLTVPFSKIKIINTISSLMFSFSKFVPYVVSSWDSDKEVYYCAALFVRFRNYSQQYLSYLYWSDESDIADPKGNIGYLSDFSNQRIAFNYKSKKEMAFVNGEASGSYHYFKIDSVPVGIYNTSFRLDGIQSITQRDTQLPLNVVGNSKVLSCFDTGYFPWISYTVNDAKTGLTNLTLPNAARIFTDAACYLWGKDIFFIFVGTGIIFSRSLETGSFGYLDTTSVLGTITQFGYLDYSEDEGTLYILGQDTDNKVKAAKIVLNTLYDYANDGAWLPMIASDGIPAYMKAKEGS